MSEHPKIRSALVGTATVLAFLAWMLIQMHECDLKSLWIEMPLLLCFIMFFPAWVRHANGFGWFILRSLLIVVFAFVLVMGYLSWLHSDCFPRWLLFPKPRIHHRAPNPVLGHESSGAVTDPPARAIHQRFSG
jgi:hypothetical protein